MESLETLKRLKSDHLAGRRGGRIAVCSAHPSVLTSAMSLALETGEALLVEATANQVNQFGGYTGRTPARFRSHLDELAATAGFPPERLLLGADHLGPHVWKRRPSPEAMAHAEELAGACVRAGFGKLHLDATAPCADDRGGPLDPDMVAERTARLCRAAEAAASAMPLGAPRPLYVIGADVPPPGGSLTDPDRVPVSQPETIAETVALTQARFRTAGLAEAWTRVLAVVAMPGVEFGDLRIAPYRPERVRALAAYHAKLPGIMTYEVHSADYQTKAAVAALIRDHFPLLKIGPCLTFAFREAVFALAHVESEWLSGRKGVPLSGIRERLEAAMAEDPVHWRPYYKGETETDLRAMRAFSHRDRIRYYWTRPGVEAAMGRLLGNLRRPIPHAILRQYLPDLFPGTASGEWEGEPGVLIHRKIEAALAPYLDACRGDARQAQPKPY